MHLPLHTLLCQDVQIQPYFMRTTKGLFIGSSMKCTLTQIWAKAAKPVEMAWEKHERPRTWKRRRYKATPPISPSCSAGLQSCECVRASVGSPALHKAKTWHRSDPLWSIILTHQAGTRRRSGNTHHPSRLRSSSLSTQSMGAPGATRSFIKRIWTKLIFIRTASQGQLQLSSFNSFQWTYAVSVSVWVCLWVLEPCNNYAHVYLIQKYGEYLQFFVICCCAKITFGYWSNDITVGFYRL